MSQVTTGIRRILEIPAVYEVFQNLLGARAAQKRLIEEFVRPFSGARILDIGCGPAAILDFLPNTVEYVGYDINPKYIAKAQKKYKERGQFFCARVNEAQVQPLHAGQFDIVLATGVLHHLNDDEAEHLFESVYQQLKSNGVLVTTDPVYVSNQSTIARYIISRDRGRNVRTFREYTRLAAKRFFPLETIILTDMANIPYTLFVMRLAKSCSPAEKTAEGLG